MEITLRFLKKKLVTKIEGSKHNQEKLELSLNIIESLDYSLSEKYKIFYKKSIGEDWGEIKQYFHTYLLLDTKVVSILKSNKNFLLDSIIFPY